MADTLTIADRVRKIISENIGVDLDKVTDDVTLYTLGADSLDMVELIMCLEEELQVEIDDDKAGDWQTVGDIVGTIEGLR